MDQELRIFTLGGLSITHGGKRIALSTRKADALLVYLVCNRRELSRELLATLLWEDESQKKALTNLRAALVNLRKNLGSYIRSTRTTIEIASDNIWLDIDELQQFLEKREVESALALYKGEFLEGFYLRGSAGFENWLALEREMMRRLVQEGLHELVSKSLSQNQFDTGITYAQRLLQMDPLDEAAQRKMMMLLAYSGQRPVALSLYEASRQLLLDELGIEPEGESHSLYLQIKDGLLSESHTPDHLALSRRIHPPAFLEESQERFSLPTVVARQAELGTLLTCLSHALDNQGQVMFLTGSAGQGKTTLINEFARQAMIQYPDLLVASGSCNNFSGIGDSYLPFRDVLSMLTGDVESRWASGAISREHALRLWKTMPATLQALAEYGDHLFDLMVTGTDLVSRAVAAGYQGSDWLERLEGSVEQQKIRQEDISQNNLFEQFTSVLNTLSKTYPLLITLDDFQWADFASISLLFHLGRRIMDSRVMVVCSYRPEEVALQRAGERHPLQKVLSEFKRQFGDIWVELDKADELRNREFIDAVLDSEPNNLEEEFRAMLFEHTGGHPLFTIELLRELQTRGDLIQTNGKWITGKKLDWNTLPARVDAVIDERIGRLDAELQEILTVASVEGEEFTAQVIATVRETEVRKLISQLSRELIKLHRLVKNSNTIQVGDHRLFRYQFHHYFYQQHLYNRLESIERELLHLEVANALERLFEGQADEIAPQLAYHFRQSGNQEKARYYLAKAGASAQSKYANQEAVEFFTQALELTSPLELASRFELLQAREEVYSIQGDRKAQLNDLVLLEVLAQDLGDVARMAQVALRKANYATLTSDYQAATEAAQQAIELARQVGVSQIEASGQLALGYALLSQGEYELATNHLKTALEFAQSLGLSQLAGECYKRLGLVNQMLEDYHQAKEYYQKAAEIYSRLGNRIGQAYVLNSLGTIDQAFWNYSESISEYNQALEMFREIGELLGEAFVLINLGLVAAYQGDYAHAQLCDESALSIFQRVDHPLGQGAALNNLGEVFCFLSDYQRSIVYFEQALKIFNESGNRPYESYALTGLGDSSLGIGEIDRAESFYRQSLAMDEEFGQMPHSIEARAGLALVALAQGRQDGALSQVSIILSFLEGGNTLGTSRSPLRVYLACYQVLQGFGDSRARGVLETAHRQLMEWAAKITDPPAYRSFLENIPWNREIVETFADLFR